MTALLTGGTVGAITFSNTGTTSLVGSFGQQTLYVEANSNQFTVNPARRGDHWRQQRRQSVDD